MKDASTTVIITLTVDQKDATRKNVPRALVVEAALASHLRGRLAS